MAKEEARSKPWLQGPASECAILTTVEMYRADAAAIAGGIAGTELMDRAGAAVATTVYEPAGTGAS